MSVRAERRRWIPLLESARSGLTTILFCALPTGVSRPVETDPPSLVPIMGMSMMQTGWPCILALEPPTRSRLRKRPTA